MIFVALGTQDKSFKRLLDIVESLNTDEKIIVQAGFTKYTSSKLEIHDYFSKDEYMKLMNEASLIICHGGVGTILNALSLNKKIIVVPRLKKYKEHQNDHQLQVARVFNNEHHIILFKDGDDINSLYNKSKDFKPIPFVSNKNNFISKLKAYLEL